jgi:predicted CDP-diglyceride synthetase/phosphatidate cytidylyltransferase
MAKRSKIGADDLGWRFHIYHATWVMAIIALFVFLDWWLALIILGLISVYFFREF